MAQCTAKSKRSGQQCQQQAMHDRNVCYMHGGKTPRGFSLPQTKTGRWSKDLPTALAARYASMESDDTLLSLRDDIRLSDALMRANFAKLATGESGEAWKLMKKAVDALTDGLNREDFPGMVKALREMRDVVDQRIAHHAAEDEIRTGLEQRRKLIETEQKLTLQGENAISVEKLMLLITAVGAIIRSNIHDAPTLSKIQNEIGLLISTPETA